MISATQLIYAQNFSVYDFKGVFLSHIKGRTRIRSLQDPPMNTDRGVANASGEPASGTPASSAPASSAPVSTETASAEPIPNDFNVHGSSSDAGFSRTGTIATQLPTADCEVLEYNPSAATQSHPTPAATLGKPIKQEFDALSPKKPRKK